MSYVSREIRSTITSSGELELSLLDVEVGDPEADEVIVRIEASPINPSDLGLLFGPADRTTVARAGTPERPVLKAAVPEGGLRGATGRLDQAMPVGNEGAGTVVATGSSELARALAGKTVAAVGGGMYAQYRKLNARLCLVLPEGTTAVDGAGCFVNPMTALGMLESMRLEGHSALVHAAAASNLGQMLVKLCLADDVPLVNIVRKPEQVELLRSLGAKHVLNSSDSGFMEGLIAAVKETGATLAFDPIGGGKLASQILTAMEAALLSSQSGFSRYGSDVHKQVYNYGQLDPSLTLLTRNYGMAWSVGGWLVGAVLKKVGAARAAELRARVAREITTTFKSHYTKVISLAEALDPDVLAAYAKQATGEKYLIDPNKS